MNNCSSLRNLCHNPLAQGASFLCLTPPSSLSSLWGIGPPERVPAHQDPEAHHYPRHLPPRLLLLWLIPTPTIPAIEKWTVKVLRQILDLPHHPTQSLPSMISTPINHSDIAFSSHYFESSSLPLAVGYRGRPWCDVSLSMESVSLRGCFRHRSPHQGFLGCYIISCMVCRSVNHHILSAK